MISVEEAMKFIVLNQQQKKNKKKEGSADKKYDGTGHMGNRWVGVLYERQEALLNLSGASPDRVKFR